MSSSRLSSNDLLVKTSILKLELDLLKKLRMRHLIEHQRYLECQETASLELANFYAMTQLRTSERDSLASFLV